MLITEDRNTDPFADSHKLVLGEAYRGSQDGVHPAVEKRISCPNPGSRLLGRSKLAPRSMDFVDLARAKDLGLVSAKVAEAEFARRRQPTRRSVGWSAGRFFPTPVTR